MNFAVKSAVNSVALFGSTLPLLSILAPAARAAPNVLVIVADDQGAQAGCYGTPAIATPVTDALAARGVLFKNNYCPYPSCSPSRASMLTGMYPHGHGITRNVGEHFGANPPASFDKQYAAVNDNFHVPGSMPTIVEALNDAGYVTGITHKFHIVPHVKFPFAQWIEQSGAADVEQFIAGAHGKPFFLMANLGPPHRPMASWVKQASDPVDAGKVALPAFLPDVPAVRQDYADYLTSVQLADRFAGDVLEGLKRSGQEANTLVIYVGDNGPSFQRGKYSEYDFGVRCPLIVAGPGVGAGGRVSAALTNFVDIMPTILDLAGVKSTAVSHGVSLRPILENVPGAQAHAITVSEVSFGKDDQSYQGRAATDGRFQYVRRNNPNAKHEMCDDDWWLKNWGNPTYDATVAAKEAFPKPFALIDLWMHRAPAEELFDLSKDPWTVDDVAKDPAYAADLARVRRLLDDHIVATQDALMKPTVGITNAK